MRWSLGRLEQMRHACQGLLRVIYASGWTLNRAAEVHLPPHARRSRETGEHVEAKAAGAPLLPHPMCVYVCICVHRSVCQWCP
jgi:hypothetical protein